MFDCEFCGAFTEFYRQAHNCPDKRFVPWGRIYSLTHQPTLYQVKLRTLRLLALDLKYLKNKTSQDDRKEFEIVQEAYFTTLKEVYELRAAGVDKLR